MSLVTGMIIVAVFGWFDAFKKCEQAAVMQKAQETDTQFDPGSQLKHIEGMENEQEDAVTLGTATQPIEALVPGCDESFLDTWDEDGASITTDTTSPALTCPEIVVFTDPKPPRRVRLGVALLQHHTAMGRSFYLEQSASLDFTIRTKENALVYNALVYFWQRCTGLEHRVVTIQEESRHEKATYVAEQEDILRARDETHTAELSAEQKNVVTLEGKLGQAEESLLAKNVAIVQQNTDHETALRSKDAELSGEQQKSMEAEKG